MPTLPQLLEEDIQCLQSALNEFLVRSDAQAALVTDKAGFLIAHQGRSDRLDLTSLAALAAGSFTANEQIARLIGEDEFDSVYQQGGRTSLVVYNVNDQSLLVVIFKASIGVGVVKYYAAPAIQRIDQQLKIARDRDPGTGLDLSFLNLADTRLLFRKKPA
jgi:predicted regulator of Ras-like GTPase activity (Roadblock/LC7/MglB family)